MLAKRPPPRPAGLPRTWEEWEAAKWHAKEERKAKRAAKKAAKANPPESLGPAVNRPNSVTARIVTQLAAVEIGSEGLIRASAQYRLKRPDPPQ
jgi:hypothetical protein